MARFVSTGTVTFRELVRNVPLVARGEMPARLRAARGFAGWSQSELGDRIEFSESTVKRWEDPENLTPIKGPVLDAIAAVTGVPRWFLDHGWGGPNGTVRQLADEAARAAEAEAQRKTAQRPARDTDPADPRPGNTGR